MAGARCLMPEMKYHCPLKINSMHPKTAFRWGILLLLLVLLFMLNLSLGSVAIPLQEIFKILTGTVSHEPVWADIIWNFRMTKAITCILGGSALALGGL